MKTTAFLYSLMALTAAAIGARAHASAGNTTAPTPAVLPSTCLAPEYHIDYPGADLSHERAASYEDCCRLCHNNRACTAYTWTSFEGGTCWLKGYRVRSEFKGANDDGSAHTISGFVYRCPRLVKDQDLEGAAEGNFRMDRPEGCCQYCFNYPGCSGFAWSDYEGGTCWFKKSGLTAVPKLGVYSCAF